MSAASFSSGVLYSALGNDPSGVMRVLDNARVGEATQFLKNLDTGSSIPLVEGMAAYHFEWINANPTRSSAFLSKISIQKNYPTRFSSLFKQTSYAKDEHICLEESLNHLMSGLWLSQYDFLGRVLDASGIRREFEPHEKGHYHKGLRDKLDAMFIDVGAPQVCLHPVPGGEDKKPDDSFYDTTTNVLHLAWRKFSGDFDPVQETLAHVFATGLKYAVFLQDSQTSALLKHNNVWHLSDSASSQSSYTPQGKRAARRLWLDSARIAYKRSDRLQKVTSHLTASYPFYGKGAAAICRTYQDVRNPESGEMLIDGVLREAGMLHAKQIVPFFDRSLGAATLSALSDEALQALTARQRMSATGLVAGDSTYGLPYRDLMPSEQVQAGRIIKNFRYEQPVQDAFAAASQNFKATDPVARLQGWQKMPWVQQRELVRDLIKDMDESLGRALGSPSLFSSETRPYIVHYAEYKSNSGYPYMAVHPYSQQECRDNPEYAKSGLSMKIGDRGWPAAQNEAGRFGFTLGTGERPVFVVLPRHTAENDKNPIWTDTPANVLAQLTRLYEIALPDRMSAISHKLTSGDHLVQKTIDHLQPFHGDVSATWRLIGAKVQEASNAGAKLSSEYREQISNHPYYKRGQIFECV